MNKYITTPQRFLVQIEMLVPRYRAAFGFCPSCNSDAPAIDDCPICESYGYGAPFPPPKELMKRWINDCQGAIEIKYQIKNAIKQARQRRQHD